MSFEEQEKVLFDLLFDAGIRQQFCTDSGALLATYDLDDREIEDFREIRVDALELDAKMRRGILLTHICRAYPLAFAIVSSLDGGLTLLKSLIDTHTMRGGSIERPVVFGTRLRDALVNYTFDVNTQRGLFIAIVEVELAMAMTGAALKKTVLDTGRSPDEKVFDEKDWASKPVKLAAHVGAAVIPRSYAELKKSFCPVPDTDLWNYLSQNPLAKSQRNEILKDETPRLLVMRARVTHMSLCEPEIGFNTAELSDGFAPLFQHINGTMSVDEILSQLKLAGAAGQLLTAVRSGFRQLLTYGMLEPAVQ